MLKAVCCCVRVEDLLLSCVSEESYFQSHFFSRDISASRNLQVWFGFSFNSDSPKASITSLPCITMTLIWNIRLLNIWTYCRRTGLKGLFESQEKGEKEEVGKKKGMMASDAPLNVPEQRSCFLCGRDLDLHDVHDRLALVRTWGHRVFFHWMGWRRETQRKVGKWV